MAESTLIFFLLKSWLGFLLGVGPLFFLDSATCPLILK